jgi:TonB family protein
MNMETDNTIKNYSAADIEKYHKGSLSAKESHDLEKAALDDPFLADALEGYAVAGVDVSSDIKDLENRLTQKIDTGKLIVMKGGGRSSIPWLRVAALVIVVAGAALLARQTLFNSKSKDIAQAEPRKEEIKPAGNATTGTTSLMTDSVVIKNNRATVIPSKQTGKTYLITTVDTMSGTPATNGANGQGNTTTGDVTMTSTPAKPVVPEPQKIASESKSFKDAPGMVDKKEMAMNDELKNKNDISKRRDFEKDSIKGLVSPSGEERQINRNVAASRKVNEDQYYRNQNQATNTFRGRVTDASNVGVPFANVTNAQDNNAGTYTDAKGYFNLTYPDTVLTVQVRSIGFENANVQLRNAVPNNQVVMQDDRKSLSEVVINNKPNAAVRRDNNNIKLEEPVPADGWDNYDAYLTNNLNVPEEIKTKKDVSGEVELTFEVDKNGEPVNIKVVKSLCDKCDQEAIRLVKEGPKWKRNAKKGKTTVKVPFNTSQ